MACDCKGRNNNSVILMKKKFSKHWKASSQRRKQRKYRINAPLHLKGKFLSARLVADLREKHKAKTARVRMGDKVRVLRGQFKGHEGKVERVDVQNSKVYVNKVEIVKKDGATKVPYGINASNLMITDMESDKKRMRQ